ncbi:MAG: tetratricopeptide repeat protein [Sedimentisphaerales bacterium]|nr:tetratricopeptide repeat protein [Sedimentisphaerales bacterium]
MCAKRRRKISSRSGRDAGRKGKKGPPEEKKVAVVPVGSEDKVTREVAAKPVKGWRLWLFRGIAVVVVPVLVLAAIEVGLRVAGYGYPTDAVVKVKIGAEPYYCDNAKFSWRFFPRNIARAFDPFAFPVDKADNTYRIFVLGASAAQGVPDGAFSFGRFLRVMLRERYPGVNFEVITAATTAINSHVILQIAKDCADREGDLFILYMGNNEVVGPYGAGTIFSPISGNLWLIRGDIALKSLRLGQLLGNLLTAGDRAGPASWQGLEMFLEKQVRAGDSSLQLVYEHFRRNLDDIIRTGLAGGAKVIACTVGSNLADCPPFASLHRMGLSDEDLSKWEEVYRRGSELEGAGKYVEATECYLQAAEIDDEYAALQFRIGRCCELTGDYEQARDSYINAREFDTLRFRADSRINGIIREVAGGRADGGVHLVDAAGVLDRACEHGIAGEDVFHEHVHLNFKGNYLLAGAVLERLEQILPERVTSRKASDRAFPTETDCAERLVYSDWSRYRIAGNLLNTYIKRAPFTNQLYHAEHVARLENEIAGFKAGLGEGFLRKLSEQYLRAIDGDSNDWWLRWRYVELLSGGLGDYQSAAEQCRVVVDSLPGYAMGHAQLARLYGRAGRTDEAVRHYLEALRLSPSADVHYRLGLTYQQRNQLDRAAKHYSKAIRLQPNHVAANANLGAVLYGQGKPDEAIGVYEKALVSVPNSVDIHFNLGILLHKQGRTNEAVKQIEEALRIDPGSAEIRRVLQKMRKSGG